MNTPNLLARSALFIALALGLTPASFAADPATDAPKPTADLISDLKASSQADPDPTLKSLGADLGDKAAALNQSLDNTPKVQGQLQKGLNSLLGNRAPAALDSLQHLTQAKLTPDQSKLAKDVYHTGSAYVVQKNFGSLEGSEGDVAQLVGSLRKGGSAEALPALKKIGGNAKLTQPQKDLLTSLTDKYAPGLKKAGDALKSVPGLGK